MGSDQKVRRTRRRLAVRYGTATPTLLAYTRNISATGLYLETTRAMRPGTGLNLEIETPERMFEMSAVVVWARVCPPAFQRTLRGGFGCRFKDPSQDWLDFYRRWASET